MKELIQPKWHELKNPEVVSLLESDLISGLTQTEAEARLRQFGRNQMNAQKPMSEWLRFLLQFAQPLMYILLIASGVTFFLGEFVDSAVIFAVTFVNALVGFLQESKAEKAIDALSKMVVTEATVRRDGRKQRVNSVGLVPGDIVILKSGDKVPADLRLLHVRSLHIDESALTGESVPVEKNAEALLPGSGIGDRKNMSFAGTLVTYGQAEGVVAAGTCGACRFRGRAAPEAPPPPPPPPRWRTAATAGQTGPRSWPSFDIVPS
jgi:Ca2+-transporting ATPase